MATPAAVLTPDEIERRVAENDTARSARRVAAARQVGELAKQHTVIATQLADIERRLGAILAEADEVVTIDELATFTDVPTATLTEWRAAHKPHRAKRKKPSITDSHTRGRPSPVRTTTGPHSHAQPVAVGADQPRRGTTPAP